MGRKAGTGGRPKGIPNKLTRDARDAFRQLLDKNVDNFQTWLTATGKKDPARALELSLRVAEFFVPKLSRTEVTGPDGGPVQILRKYFGSTPPSATN